jgi:hypothetical protein
MRISKKVLAGTISAFLLFAAPPAFGVTSAQSGYSKPGGIVETQIENSGGGNNPGGSIVSTPESATQARSSAHGTLPFTGLDLVLVVAAGGLLLALGLGMRRLTRPPSAA